MPLRNQRRREKCKRSPESRWIANCIPRVIRAMPWIVDNFIHSELDDLAADIIFAKRRDGHGAVPPPTQRQLMPRQYQPRPKYLSSKSANSSISPGGRGNLRRPQYALIPDNQSRGYILTSDNEVERRRVASTTNETDLSRSSTHSLIHRRCRPAIARTDC